MILYCLPVVPYFVVFLLALYFHVVRLFAWYLWCSVVCSMWCFRSRVTTEDVIGDLKRVDIFLRELMYKYEVELDNANIAIRTARSTRLLGLLRRRKLMHKCLEQCEQRLAVCLQKQCALEQLEITRMQIHAIQRTSRVFKIFTKKHSLKRVEELSETMVELQEDMMDVSALLAEPVFDEELNIDAELAELMLERRLEDEKSVGTDVNDEELPDISDIPGKFKVLEFPESKTATSEAETQLLVAI